MLRHPTLPLPPSPGPSLASNPQDPTTGLRHRLPQPLQQGQHAPCLSHALSRHGPGPLLTGTCPHCPLRSSNSRLRPKHRRWGFRGKGRHDGAGRIGNAEPLPGNLSHENEERRSSAPRSRNRARGTQPGAPRILPGTALDDGPGPLPPGPELSGPTAPGASTRKASPQPGRPAGPAARSAAAQLRPGPAPRPRGTPHLRPGAARRGAPAARAAPWPEPRPSGPIRAAPSVPSRPESTRAVRGRAADINGSTRFRPGRGRRGRPSCSHRACTPATKSPPAAPAAPGLSRAAERSRELCGAGALPAVPLHGATGPARPSYGWMSACSCLLLLPG